MKAATITVWDRDGTIIALAVEIWGVNIIFLNQGAYFNRLPGAIKSPIRMWRGIMYRVGR